MTRSHEHPVKKAAAAGGKRIATRMRTMSDDLTIVAVTVAGGGGGGGGDGGSVGCSRCVLYGVYGEGSFGLPLCGWMVVYEYSILNDGSVVLVRDARVEEKRTKLNASGAARRGRLSGWAVVGRRKREPSWPARL